MNTANPPAPQNDNASADNASGPAQATTQAEAANVNANEELAEAIKQRDDYLDQLQRSRAEFANYQKRSKTQADSDRVYVVGSLGRDLLDAIDNLERAAEALKANAAAGIADGVLMVHKQLLATLSKHGIEPIEALGRPFDPNQHEALMQQTDADRPDGTVVSEMSRGFKIHDRVLRPSKVAVSVKPADA